MKEYHRAVRRLTLGYIFAIFVACTVFTLPVVIAVNYQTQGNLRIIRGEHTVRMRESGGDEGLRMTLMLRAKEDRQRLLGIIFVINAALLGVGAVASYYFARRTLKPLEEAHDAQRRFTADASHELRTPLAVMQTELEVALKAKKGKPGLEKVIRGTISELRQLSALTEKLLHLTKTDEGKLAKESIDLGEATRDTVARLEKTYGITIACDIGSSLTRPAHKEFYVQLVEILIDNAVKYAGKGSPHIAVTLAGNHDTATLTVSDKGIGIPERDLPHVFDRLYRARNVSTEEGHGLGLALAKSIADIHGWELSVSSELGEGTIVRVDMPKI